MQTVQIEDGALPYLGLTSEQVKFNRKKYGTNVLTPPKRDPWWKLYLEKFADPVIRILIIAAIIAIGVGIVEGEYIEGLGIVVAILLSTTIAFINEYKACKEFELLNSVYDRSAVKVIREGNYTTIPRQELVVGDIVFVEQGEEIPADGEILEAVSLYVNQAKITGESEAVKKLTKAKAKRENREAETTYPAYNLYRSTIIDLGHGVYRVTAVGDRTEIGKVATVVASVETGEETPLNIQLEKLSKLIGLVGLSVAGLTFLALMVRGFITGKLSLSTQQGYFVLLLILSLLAILSRVWLPVIYDGLQLVNSRIEIPLWWKKNNGLKGWSIAVGMGLLLLAIGIGVGYPLGLVPSLSESWLPANVATALINYFMVAVTIIVVAVPEGLPMSVTLSLAYSMRKMAASNNLVRRMHACETIGAATVICSDKTGTLTQNQMQVREIDFPCLHSPNPSESNLYRKLIAEAIAANSTANLEKKPQQPHRPQQPPRPLGNATEGALLLWLDSQNLDYIHYRHNFKIQSQITFCSQKKYMGTWGTSAVIPGEVIYIKGAPEVILSRCCHIESDRGKEPLTGVEPILTQIQEYQARGMRTIGFAYRRVAPNLPESTIDQIDRGFTWLGFMAISDPLRKEVPQAIDACLRAGIGVKVVTGDSPETAKEIARQIGLLQEEDLYNPRTHLTGQQFKQLNDSEVKEAVRSLKILSRACPLDKLRLVKLLQEDSQVVAVTGDGTNDAAALKQAQVGLSMGSGTAIAKEASDIILLDDSFSSIVNAVIWGRSLYQNIQRFILFQLTINVVALGIALLGPFIGVALPLTVTQMLWVNLIMDTFAALALATEPPQKKVMEKSPRSKEAFIVSPAMAQNIFTSGLIFLGFSLGLLLYMGSDRQVTPYELSVFFAVFVFLQFWNLFNARCWGLDRFACSGLFKNKGFVAIAATIFIGQILIIQFGTKVFRTVPLSLRDWIIIIAATSLVLWLEEFWRWLKRNYRRLDKQSSINYAESYYLDRHR